MKHLFSPITINGMTLANRIVMPAMHLNYTMGGEVSDQLIAFYAERAAGGAGLLIVGGCSIDKAGGGPMLIGLDEPRFEPGLERFVREVGSAGEKVKLGAQLYHAGRYSWSMLTGMQSISASALPSRYTHEMPRALTLDEIPEVQHKFVAAALRARDVGFDCCEIIASAGYLINQFLSPLVNQRDDEYGGSFANRARFGIEVVQQVRQALGPDYPLLVRVAGNDFMEGGQGSAETIQVAQLYVEAGADCINVTGGWHETRVPQLTMSVPRGAYVYLASGVKRALDVPVVASNRIPDPLLADRIIAQGHADLIGMARPLIADPELPNKARRGESKLIRNCIACNQGCFDAVFAGMPVGCMVNARVGREHQVQLRPAEHKRKVIVVGGGPAGMEAARVAALCGHQVVLFESEDQLGGLLPMAAAPPGRQEFNELTRYFRETLAQLGNVELRLGTEATIDEIVAEQPDAVIIATGAEPIVPEFARDADPARVLMAHDVLSSKRIVPGDAVIIGAGAVGCETALFLADRDTIDPQTACFLLEQKAESPERVQQLLNQCSRKIALIEMQGRIGADIGKTTRWTVLKDLRRYGVRTRVNKRVVGLTQSGLLLESDGMEPEEMTAETIVIAVGYRSRPSALYKQLEQKGIKGLLIGDAKAARKVLEAVREGFDAANGL
ncbi:MAG: FAD-dependent oxidoreductase [Candidatus Alcyoniella australis]|nr:FAD-dependent oxidoreductase [Candidatus Alcyoniella australis]